MYIKSKWKTWVFLIILALSIKVLPGYIKTFLTERAERKRADEIVTTYMITVNDVNSAIKNKILKDKINVNGKNVKFIDSFGEPDIIITRNDEAHDGYIELKDYLYVPYVMVSNPNLKGYSQECFGKLEGNKFKKDIRYILSAIEEDKKWKDLGIDGDSIVKGKVSFIVPDKYSQAYQDIREYFILALNDFNMPSENEIDELTMRADKILEKCTKVESIQSEFTKSSWFKQIILCEESIIAERPSNFGSCIIINPGKTIKAEYNVYVKEDKLDEVKVILKSYKFLELSGFRNIEYNNTLESEPYTRSFVTFDYIDIKIPDEMQRPITDLKKETDATTESIMACLNITDFPRKETDTTTDSIEESSAEEITEENDFEENSLEEALEETEDNEESEEESTLDSDENGKHSLVNTVLTIILILLVVLLILSIGTFLFY